MHNRSLDLLPCSLKHLMQEQKKVQMLVWPIYTYQTKRACWWTLHRECHVCLSNTCNFSLEHPLLSYRELGCIFPPPPSLCSSVAVSKRYFFSNHVFCWHLSVCNCQQNFQGPFTSSAALEIKPTSFTNNFSSMHAQIWVFFQPIWLNAWKPHFFFSFSKEFWGFSCS